MDRLKKLFLKKADKTSLFVVLLLLLTLPTFALIVRPGFFFMHDDMQAFRLLELDKCLSDGQIPCRWVPDAGYGYGYPQFQYYPPLPYYVGEVFHLAGLQFIDAVKAMIIFSLIASALTMFFFARRLFGNLGGMLAAAFYLYGPYRAMDIYVRGAMGEFWAMAFLPAVLWAIYEIVVGKDKKFIPVLAVSFAALLTSHPLTALIFTPLAIAWGLLLIFQEMNLRRILPLAFGAVWGGGLASFFIIPAILEKKFAHLETLLYGYFNFLAHFVSLRQLFTSFNWGYGSSILGPNDEMSFSVGHLHWTVGTVVFALAVWFFAKKKKTSVQLIFFFLVGLAAAFLTHQRSTFIWQNFSLLAWLQFPWRFLTLTLLVSSTLVGGLIIFLQNETLKRVTTAALIVGVVGLNYAYFRPTNWVDITDREKFSGALWDKQQTISIFDYLPIFAILPPTARAPEKPYVLEGEAKVVTWEKGTNWQKGEIEVASSVGVVVELPLFYYPGFKVRIDGEEAVVSYRNFLGLMRVKVPPGRHTVEARLHDTPVRASANALTLASLLTLFTWPWWTRKRLFLPK